MSGHHRLATYFPAWRRPGLPVRARVHWRTCRPVFLPVLFAAAMLLAWQVLTVQLAVSPMLLVPPTAIWDVLAQAWPILAAQAWPTLVNAVVGFLLASVIGIALGGALVVSRRVEQAFWPHILIFQLVPKVAVAPLFIIWLGMGPTSRLCFAVFLSFFPITVSAATGFRSVDRTALRLCQSLTASRWQTFLHVRIPYAIPHIFAGLKVGVTVAIIGVVIGEFVTAQEGLGYIIMFASSAAETALVFAAIALLCVIGLAMYGAVALAELFVRRWYGAPINVGGFE
ncbi:ABC transporter permease [Rhodopila sp.]|uniref:ABC transporter permease n=1 Tax=Rhodopila sp. TaxID=2480087 RepID=UPI003D100A83